MNHFALADAAGISAAIVLFLPLVFFPGYLLAHCLDPWRFRTRSLAFQLPASVSLSLSVGPILTFLVGSVAGWLTVWCAYLCCALASCYLLLRARPQIDKTVCAGLLVGFGWFVLATVWVMDWQSSSSVYFPIYALDYSTRTAFVHSLAAFGLPAQNPLFNPGHSVALHYHFLWLCQCALVHWIAPTLVTARAALIAGAIWCGLGLMCVGALVMRIMLERRGWIVIGLLAVSGLGIVPLFLQLPPNSLHLLAMLHTALWQPHYICALIASVTGFLILWQSKGIAPPVVAALCFGSAVGSGSFVVLIMGAFLAVWMALNFRRSLPLAIAGALTLVFSVPYFTTLSGPAQNVGDANLLSFSVISFSAAQPGGILKLLLLPVNYLVEFGLFAIIGWLGYYYRRARPEWALVLMAATSIAVCTFVKSGATQNNDLGWRGLLVAQFALVILSAAYLEGRKTKTILKVLLAIGLLGSAYDLLLTRFFPILADTTHVPKPKWLGADEQLGRRTLANREAYKWLAGHSTQTALVGQNPNVDTVDVFSGLYGDRNLVAGDWNCTIGFGGSAVECAPIVAALTKLFAGQAEFARTCAALPGHFYVVKDTDPVWRQSRSWIWTEKPVFANKFVRIFECAKSNAAEK